MVFCIVQILKHRSRLCEQCITAMPLDAEAQAERKRRSLRWFHITSRPVFLLGWITLGVVSLFLPPVPGSCLLAVFSGIAVVSWVTSWRHRPLQSVCPWCYWRGGDDEQEVPTPVPTGVKEA
jgi:hypothetical protein